MLLYHGRSKFLSKHVAQCHVSWLCPKAPLSKLCHLTLRQGSHSESAFSTHRLNSDFMILWYGSFLSWTIVWTLTDVNLESRMLSKIVPLADYSVLRQCHMCVETLVYLLPPIKQTAVAHRQSIRINWICRWCNSWWRTAWLIWFQLHLASDNFEAVRDYDGVSLEGSRAENSSDKSNMMCCQERSFDSCCVNWSTGLCTVKASHMLRYLWCWPPGVAHHGIRGPCWGH